MRLLTVVILALIFAVGAIGQQNLKIGQAAPDFAAQTIEGETLNLSQLRGKIVVLTFWSSRCEICVSEIPKLNQVVERYKGKDVVFLALTMENDVKVNHFLKKHPFSYTILTNGFGVVLKYANMGKDGSIDMGFPSYFIINKDGSIRLRAEGWDKAPNLDAQISRLLAE